MGILSKQFGKMACQKKVFLMKIDLCGHAKVNGIKQKSCQRPKMWGETMWIYPHGF